MKTQEGGEGGVLSLSKRPDRVDVSVRGVGNAGAAIEHARDALLLPVPARQLHLPARGG